MSMRANLFGWLAVGAVATASVVASSGAGASSAPLTITTTSATSPVPFTLAPGGSSTSAVTLTNTTAKQRFTVRLASSATVINVKALPSVIEPGAHTTMYYGVSVPVDARPGEIQATVVARIERAESANGTERPVPSPVSVPVKITVTGAPAAANNSVAQTSAERWTAPVIGGAMLLIVILGLLTLRRRTLRRRRANRFSVDPPNRTAIEAILLDEPEPEPPLDFDTVLFDIEAVDGDADKHADVIVDEEPVEMVVDEEPVIEIEPASAAAPTEDDEPPDIVVELVTTIANLTDAVDRLTARLEEPLIVGGPTIAPWRRQLDEAFDWPSEDDLTTYLDAQTPGVDRAR